uniref:DUF3267 domain-containing protein n=1 Tax=uncultured Allobacillus sp. TaxID=1638025 RepID=UPI0025996F3D|nr:DUF3267 domain-containing protein [uncultured Allobacillus sp.]
MTCWKTVNVTKEIGQNRLLLLSILTAILAFIVLYMPFSIVFQHIQLAEPPFASVVISLFLLPIMHKLIHVAPILFTNKTIHLKWKVKYKVIVSLRAQMESTLSKKTSILSIIAPTLIITLPLIILAYYIPAYHPILLFMAAIHIGMSLHDWLTLFSILRAPKKSVIEKSQNEFDILVRD